MRGSTTYKCTQGHFVHMTEFHDHDGLCMCSEPCPFGDDGELILESAEYSQ